MRRQLTATAPTADCPRGAAPSSSVHSRSQRRLTDLPWGMRAVRLPLPVRPCRCRHCAGGRRLCTERLPDRVATDARNMHRLTAVRLRLVRAAPGPSTPALQAVGIGEWAWRRGHRYGTILVNRAAHRVVDRRPDRSATTVAAWLAAPPTRTGVRRAQRDLDADGMRRGAPGAVPVVARCPLVHHLRQAREAFRRNHRTALQAAAIGTAPACLPRSRPRPRALMDRGRRQRSPQRQLRAEAARQCRHALLVASAEAVQTLQAQGTPRTRIARPQGSRRPTLNAEWGRQHAALA